MPMAAS